MASRLPPLNAVRAFVAAARHESFTRAAADLHVTHGAISRQIKTLETHLGLLLFERQTRQVRLTAAGQFFFAEAAAALEQISAATETLTGPPQTRAVRINVRPSFAVRWLIPRLPGFVATYPGIEPQVVTSVMDPVDVPDTFDVAIRRSPDGWPDAMRPRPFLDDQALIVGAPALRKAHRIAEPPDLGALVLLSSKSRPRDWNDWRKFAHVPRLKPAGQLQFDHLHFVLQAAVDGLGFALAPASLIAHDLASGRLQHLLPALCMPLPSHYYGVSPNPGTATRCFVAWLESERAQQAARTERADGTPEEIAASGDGSIAPERS